MADVLNRTTKQYLKSVNTPDFPVIDWIINPDLSGVLPQEPQSKYWNIAGDVVTEMTPAEKAAVDAAEVAAAVSANRAAAISALTTPAEGSTQLVEGIQLRELIELFNKRDNFLVNRIVEIQNALLTVESTGGNANNRLNTLPASYLATNTRTRAQAITDYTDDINAGGADT